MAANDQLVAEVGTTYVRWSGWTRSNLILFYLPFIQRPTRSLPRWSEKFGRRLPFPAIWLIQFFHVEASVCQDPPRYCCRYLIATRIAVVIIYVLPKNRIEFFYNNNRDLVLCTSYSSLSKALGLIYRLFLLLFLSFPSLPFPFISIIGWSMNSFRLQWIYGWTSLDTSNLCPPVYFWEGVYRFQYNWSYCRADRL